jgi:mono/diheme cytochrome c family protein
LLVAVLAAAFFFTYSGAYNVAALTPSGGIVDWLAGTTMDHSVQAHASGISIPNLDDSNLVALGFDHYKEMCITCHGSPAGGMSEAGMGLNPKAPELSEAAKDWTPAELYWIVKNGVKMTGMPAFAPTHSEKELWAMVAFLEKLKGMTPTEYKAFASSKAEPGEDPQQEEGSEGHHHREMDMKD